MAAFSTLTPADQKAVTDFTTAFRARVSKMAIILDQLVALNQNYVGVVGPIMNNLDPGVPFSDGTNLDGAVELTPFQVGTIMNDIQALLVTNTDAKRQVWSAACGPVNMTGQ